MGKFQPLPAGKGRCWADSGLPRAMQAAGAPAGPPPSAAPRLGLPASWPARSLGLPRVLARSESRPAPCPGLLRVSARFVSRPAPRLGQLRAPASSAPGPHPGRPGFSSVSAASGALPAGRVWIGPSVRPDPQRVKDCVSSIPGKYLHGYFWN
jgi:hypothetical protein